MKAWVLCVPAAQNVTVDEVIGAYKQACQKLNCRQIPKLLRQLQVRARGEGRAQSRGRGRGRGGGGGPWAEALLPLRSPLTASGPLGSALSREGCTEHHPRPANWPRAPVNTSWKILCSVAKAVRLFLNV